MMGDNTCYNFKTPIKIEELQAEVTRRCCVQTNSTSLNVYFSFQTIRLCCDECFNPFDFFITEPIFKYTYLHVCTPIGSIPLNCYSCKRNLLHIRPMYECYECYNYYFQLDNQISTIKNIFGNENRSNLSNDPVKRIPFPELFGMLNYCYPNYDTNDMENCLEVTLGNEFEAIRINKQ